MARISKKRARRGQSKSFREKPCDFLTAYIHQDGESGALPMGFDSGHSWLLRWEVRLHGESRALINTPTCSPCDVVILLKFAGGGLVAVRIHLYIRHLLGRRHRFLVSGGWFRRRIRQVLAKPVRALFVTLFVRASRRESLGIQPKGIMAR